MKYSLVTPKYHVDNIDDINKLPRGVGNLKGVPVGQLTGLRSIDVRQLEGIRMYTVPLRLDDESDFDYGTRIQVEVVAGVAQVIAGTLDGIYLEDENDLKIYKQLVGWTEPPLV